MTTVEGILDCKNCEFSTLDGDMCPFVAIESLKNLTKRGYDSTSETGRPSEVITRMLDNPVVREIAEEECRFKKLGRASIDRGYGTMVD
jgi:hypothetical protein